MSFEKCYYLMRLFICHYCWINEVENVDEQRSNDEPIDLATVLLYQEIDFD